jgi:hypothetical protein
MLTIRKLANKEDQERVRKFDPETGQPKLVNPATPGEDHEPWPLLGVVVEGQPPKYTTAGVAWVNAACAEGWMRRIGERAVARPGGPPNAPWSTVHTFVQADRLEIEDYDRGVVTYRVVQNPDKFWASGEPVEEYGFASDEELAGTEVQHFYELMLVDNG